nr:Com family DNA-binding transcriptional regulator [Stenotrophomonas sp. Iso1]
MRCGACARLLAKGTGLYELQIKCTRCGVLNHMKAESLPMDRRERHQEGSNNEERTDPRRRSERPSHTAVRQL